MKKKIKVIYTYNPKKIRQLGREGGNAHERERGGVNVSRKR